MRILVIHNQYQEAGGEDVAAVSEANLLRDRGHDVTLITQQNTEGMNPLRAGVNATWSRRWRRDVERLIDNNSIDVVHVHNFFPQFSPSIYYAANAAGVPVVQTLHNYRLVCPGALLWREGSTCEECLGRRIAWPGVVHGCYRHSSGATAAVATMLTVHSALGTWEKRVDAYIALSSFAKQKFLDGGLPEDRVWVKPNFLHTAPTITTTPSQRRGAIYVGRLSEEKGIRFLLEAWTHLRDIPLSIVGDGPLAPEIARLVGALDLTSCVSLRGPLNRDEVFRELSAARFLVFPTEVYEGFPMTIAEAYGCGTPVIGTNLGATAELIEDGRTGLLFDLKQARSLVEKVRLANAAGSALDEMSRYCRTAFQNKYSASANYRLLITIYEAALERRATRGTEGTYPEHHFDDRGKE